MLPRHAHAVIRAHKNAGKAERNQWEKYHDWYLAEIDHSQRWVDEYNLPAGNDELTLETNYPYAYIDTMIASICPTNPMITISARNPEVEEQAKMREMLANDTMRRNELHEKGWRLAGHTALTGYGVSKTVWNFRKKRPITYVVDPRKIIWDRGVADWDDVTYVAEATVLRREEFLARSRRRRNRGGGSTPPRYRPSVSKQAKFGGYPAWLKKAGDEDRTSLRDVARDVFEYVTVWEFWDFVSGNYWHFLEDVEEPLLESPLPNRWVRNPYDLVTFNDNLMDTSGISDVKLISNLQERLNEIDTLELWFAQTTMPINVLNEAGLENPEAAKDAIQNATGPGATASIGLAQNYRNIKEVFTTTPVPSLSPSWDKMRARTERIIEFTLGLPQFMRGGLGQAEIATEAALADAGIRTRNGRRVRVMEKWQTSVAKKYIALFGERMDPTKPISIREPGKRKFQQAEFEDFGFEDVTSFDDDWFYEYEAAPYSPTENHALVQLQKLQQFAPILKESPFVDQEKLDSRLLELLRMSDLKADQPQQPMPVAGQPGVPGSPGMQANDVGGGQIPPELAAQMQALMQTARPYTPGVSEPPAEF